MESHIGQCRTYTCHTALFLPLARVDGKFEKWSIDLGKPEKALTKKPKESPEWAVNRTPSSIVAVPNLRPKIANKLSKPSIEVSDENIVDDLDNVTEPGKKHKTKSEPKKVDKITFRGDLDF